MTPGPVAVGATGEPLPQDSTLRERARRLTTRIGDARNRGIRMWAPSGLEDGQFRIQVSTAIEGRGAHSEAFAPTNPVIDPSFTFRVPPTNVVLMRQKTA